MTDLNSTMPTPGPKGTEYLIKPQGCYADCKSIHSHANQMLNSVINDPVLPLTEN